MAFENMLYDQGEAPDVVDQSVNGITFLGWTRPGTTGTHQPLFKVKRITEENGHTVTTWADGNRNYDNIWDDRATLEYTFLK